jgi:uncharacterized protein DUF3606
MITRRKQFGTARNCLDLRDHVQVKVLRRRLKISDEQLASIARKTGNSITAISKEARRQRLCLP